MQKKKKKIMTGGKKLKTPSADILSEPLGVASSDVSSTQSGNTINMDGLHHNVSDIPPRVEVHEGGAKEDAAVNKFLQKRKKKIKTIHKNDQKKQKTTKLISKKSTSGRVTIWDMVKDTCTPTKKKDDETTKFCDDKHEVNDLLDGLFEGDSPFSTSSSSSSNSGGPQLLLGEDGEISLDSCSLSVAYGGHVGDADGLERVTETLAPWHGVYKTTKAIKWTDDDTKLFYKAVIMFKSDFSLMKSIIPHISHKELIKKFKKERRLHPNKFKCAMTTVKHITDTEFKKNNYINMEDHHNSSKKIGNETDIDVLDSNLNFNALQSDTIEIIKDIQESTTTVTD
eukprot:GHVL01028836.1.p1 GENE.GHVL01028836.1~~GHVL01028836.1.p1  ORF type:complete len:340 (-),score=83.41 GHVL01028836.1:497-1516(-)